MGFARAQPSYGLIRRPDQSINVIACDKREAFAQGSACDEAIHAAASRKLDCFASLAMTLMEFRANPPCTARAIDYGFGQPHLAARAGIP
jgi:hypothetical protein